MIDTIYAKINDTLSKYKEDIAFLDYCSLKSYIDLLFDLAKSKRETNE